MIKVRRTHTGWSWSAPLYISRANLDRVSDRGSFASASSALRDAWTWWPELAALVYTGAP